MVGYSRQEDRYLELICDPQSIGKEQRHHGSVIPVPEGHRINREFTQDQLTLLIGHGIPGSIYASEFVSSVPEYNQMIIDEVRYP